MPASPWATVPSVKPVIAHAGSVPLQATVPAPLKPALRSRTFHVHAATIFLHWNMAVGAWLGCFLDCFFRCLFPPGLHGCIPLRGILLYIHGRTQTHSLFHCLVHIQFSSLLVQVADLRHSWELDTAGHPSAARRELWPERDM